MRTAKELSALIIAGLVLASCTSTSFRPLSSGETRLTRMEMPDVVKEDLPYEVILSVESEGRPMVRKACFRWVSEEISTRSPTLYSYSNWTGADLSKGPSAEKWVQDGISRGSDTFCTGPENIRTDIPGKLMVKIRAENLDAKYNKLEGQVEYISQGRTRLSNKVSTRVAVEK